MNVEAMSDPWCCECHDYGRYQCMVCGEFFCEDHVRGHEEECE